ncbi:efflux RND transporter periplasmic adaptor subunit [Pseudoalteromonas sp. G4]|uniref:efflux RND transporter periplasmic adaptor subunit n=1 Tax=Pseudoalteromonas sp. G4 TaxID=2992761 RepID=UPI00237ECBC6|nr:HlyD family efflux transporter periplasmic adaptor subunit [Pseudoalteromonas sp. G4]MDE3270750.1 HlyD family efflux transporter periplasmic adaptor subunit [Pseudoalteromonas sp. G4]
MDIKIENKSHKLKRPLTYAIFACLLLSAVMFIRHYTQGASNLVKRDEILVAKVKQGDFVIDVKGLGSLALEKRHLITTNAGGKVVEVLIKPGEYVERGDIIARLDNPQIKETLIQKNSLLLKMVAQHKAELAQQKAYLQEAETAYHDADLAHKANTMEWQAQATLIAQGNSTISKLEHQRSEFTVKRSLKQLALQKAKVATQKEILTAKQNAQQAEQQSLKSEINLLSQHISQLDVKSPITGQIQDVFVELGTQLASTGSVAEVADQTKLIAKINVAELDAPNVKVGQQATIDTYTSRLDAQVIRVSPKVNNGHVEVELSLIDAIPSEARDKLNIEGIINTSFKTHTLFVALPRNAIAESTNNVFVLEKHLATKQAVTFGKRSVNYIEVVAGLTIDQEIIISDMEKYTNDTQVLVR